MQDRAMRLDNALKRGQIGLQALETLAMRKQIARDFNIPLKDVNAAWRKNRGGGGASPSSEPSETVQS
jgi:hypothetical protein